MPEAKHASGEILFGMFAEGWLRRRFFRASIASPFENN
jgi:hypothetical protein